MWSVPAMLAISVLFAPGLLAFLLLAAALECYLLKRPEERAARAADPAEPPQPAPTPPQPAPVPAEPVPFPILAHLPSPPDVSRRVAFGNETSDAAIGRPALQPPDQAEPLAD